jgi:hypothetical protein
MNTNSLSERYIGKFKMTTQEDYVIECAEILNLFYQAVNIW